MIRSNRPHATAEAIQTHPPGKNHACGLPTCARKLRQIRFGTHIVNLKINRGNGNMIYLVSF